MVFLSCLIALLHKPSRSNSLAGNLCTHRVRMGAAEPSRDRIPNTNAARSPRTSDRQLLWVKRSHEHTLNAVIAITCLKAALRGQI
jgi:hypothetical protein